MRDLARRPATEPRGLTEGDLFRGYGLTRRELLAGLEAQDEALEVHGTDGEPVLIDLTDGAVGRLVRLLIRGERCPCGRDHR